MRERSDNAAGQVELSEASQQASPSLKFIPLDEDLCRYVAAHRSRSHDPVLDDLRAETEKLGSLSEMLVSREQGSFLTLLVAALGVRSAVEIGTFTGYSAICIARGLGPEGRLLCIDVNADWTAIGRRYWKRAGVEGKIELSLRGGQAELEALPAKPAFDFAFIDADKPGYNLCYELTLPRLRSNGLIVFDNMLQRGRVVEPKDESALAIDALNKKLCSDPRVECVLLTVADGLMVCRKV
ncbi:MAG: class I SAM-dependent methyltransferase [Terrimicrobiaceae bacterium]